MKKGVMFVLLALLLLPMAGCNADESLVEDESEFVPYWWRDDPYFKDKNIDEEATLALGDPNVVLGKNKDDEKNKMYQAFTEKLGELYGAEHIPHLLIYHRDKVFNLVLPGVDMSLMKHEIPGPSPNEVIDEHCTCPWEWESGIPPEGCEPGGGGGGGSPPPPITIGGTGFWLDEGYIYPPNPRSMRMRNFTESSSTMDISKLKNIRLEKDGVLVYHVPYETRYFTKKHHHNKTVYFNGSRKAWRGECHHDAIVTFFVTRFIKFTWQNSEY